MSVKKIVRLLIALHLGLFYSSASAEQAPFFSEDEILQLNHSEEEWLFELDRLRSSRVADSNGWVDELSPPAGKQDSTGIKGVKKSATSESFGPIVAIVVPKAAGDYYRSFVPVKLLVYLKSREAPINIDSLLAKGKRGFFSLNITKKLKAYLRRPQQGEDADYVIDAEIPKLRAGRYQLTLSLADINGKKEERSVFLEVIRN